MCKTACYIKRLLALALVPMLAWAGPAAAQDVALAAEAATGPLLKADLVRMLAVGDYDDDDLMHIVQMNCVAFRPTERDRSDLLSLPGGSTVLNSISKCRASERQASGFDRGIPVARPVQELTQEPDPRTPAELKSAVLRTETLDERPALATPRLVVVVEDDRAQIAPTEVPPRLENWTEVSNKLLSEYRPNERKAGRAVIRVRVDESGRAADSLLKTSSGDPSLDAAVLSTVSVMRFTPAMSRDRRVSAWTEIPIEFETP